MLGRAAITEAATATRDGDQLFNVGADTIGQPRLRRGSGVTGLGGPGPAGLVTTPAGQRYLATRPRPG